MGATHLLELGAVAVPVPLREETLFGADLDQQGLQVGEDLAVRELAHPHGPLGGVHVADAHHALSVGARAQLHRHDPGAALCTGPTPKQDLLKLGQVAGRSLGRFKG